MKHSQIFLIFYILSPVFFFFNSLFYTSDTGQRCSDGSRLGWAYGTFWSDVKNSMPFIGTDMTCMLEQVFYAVFPCSPGCFFVL